MSELSEILVRVRALNGSYPPPVDCGPSATELRGWLGTPVTQAAWVGLVDDAVAGHVALEAPSEYLSRFLGPDVPAVLVGQLFVDPAVRGRGLGRELLVHARDRARDRGLVPALAVVEGWDTAVTLYRSSGMVELGAFDGRHGRNLVFVG